MVRIRVYVCAFVLLACCLPMVAQQSAATSADDPAAPPAPITGSGTVVLFLYLPGLRRLAIPRSLRPSGQCRDWDHGATAKLDVKGTGNVRDTLTLFPKLTHPSLSIKGTAFASATPGK